MRDVIHFSRLFLLSSSVLVSACAGPEEAPKELNALARFFFNKFKPEDPQNPGTSDVELQDAVNKLHDVLKADDLKLDEPQLGTLENITQKEIDTVGMDVDPDKGQGMFMANIIKCSMDKMEDLWLDPDQMELYPETYSAYKRTMDEDTPDYLPTWTTEYTIAETPPLTNQFSAVVKTGLRTVPETEDAEHGEAFVSGAFMPEPAEFESDGSEFSFDFQIETVYSRGGGELVHFYAVWRYMKIGVFGDSYDDYIIDTTLSTMVDWDEDTEALCN
jgi:hypothetical protein